MIKKYLMLALAAILLLPQLAQAVPAYPFRKTLRLQDGSVIEATYSGDEFSHYYLSDEGKVLVPAQDGCFRMLSEFEVALMRENSSDQRTGANSRRARRRIGTINPLYGKKKGLVILVQFRDCEFVTPEPLTVYKDFFNKEGYTDYGMTGSVSDYFRAQSYGQFELEFDVVGPVTLSKTMYFYGNNDNGDAAAMVKEACEAANSTVNFADYDWDRDGEVDQVFIIYAGYGENYGADANTIWPHESQIGGNLIMDRTRINTYACTCELSGTVGSNLDGIGTACHEFSHCIGFPDMYDTEGNNFAMAYWDLLSSGSYNNNSRTPAGYTAYERWQAGWLTPTELTTQTQITNMKPLTEAPEAYVLYNDGHPDEYYLLENRQYTGFDAALHGHGLLVVHVDYDPSSWASNRVNVGPVQHMTIIAADDHYSNASSSMAGDPYPGRYGITSLTDDNISQSSLLHNPNTDGTLYMHKSIEKITENDNLISFLALRPDLGIPQVSLNRIDDTSFNISWDPIEGAVEYEISLTEVPAKGNPAEARVLEEDFKGAYKSSAGFSDISSKLTGILSTSGFSGTALYQTPNLLRFGTSSVNGTLRTPVLSALSTGHATIVMKMMPFTEGTEVTGNVSIITNNKDTEVIPISFSTTTTMILYPQTMLDEIFRIDIEPAGRCYIQYLAVYDGEFSAQELGLSDAKQQAPRRRVKSETYRCKGTNATLDQLIPTSTYLVQVRTLGEDRVSKWSQELSWTSGASAVNAVKADAATLGEAWFDLQGRKIAAPTQRGIYIHQGKKIFVK